MEVLHARCAGLDVHKTQVTACRRIAVDGRVSQDVRSFPTVTSGLLALAEWLGEAECTHVAMEATGVYWKPVWHVLEGSFELVLANAQHVRNVPGRKSDVSDAMWRRSRTPADLRSPRAPAFGKLSLEISSSSSGRPIAHHATEFPRKLVIASMINVPQTGIDIRGVIVDASIAHANVGDLVIQVIAPNGETVTLSNRQGGSADNFIATGRDLTAGFTPYLPATGQWQLVVRDLAASEVGTINSFTLHLVSDPMADFSITPSPTSQTLIAGTSTTYTINTAVLSGAAQQISLSLSGLPAGVHGSFSPASVIAGGSSTLTLTSSVTTVTGTTQFTIIGTGTATNHTVNASVSVAADPPPTVTITAPAGGSTVGGVVTVSANASDADGVTSVEFDLPDGTIVIDTSAPFSALWDSTASPMAAAT